MPSLDLLLRGGRVIDPAQGIDEVRDIGFHDGRVIAAEEAGAADEILDVSGCIVAPGFIDLHTHVYWGATALGVPAEEAARRGGATTVVDAGSAGAGNFIGLLRYVIDASTPRIISFLNIAYGGIHAFGEEVRLGEALDPHLLSIPACVRMARQYPSQIRGVKVRLGLHGSGSQGLAPLEPALIAAEEAGVPLMVHIDHAPPTALDVVRQLRSGDVLTHIYRALPDGVAESEDMLAEALTLARTKGIVCDVAHGQGSFVWPIARRMIARVGPPDVISSDLHRFNVNGPVHGLLVTLEKFLALGLALPDVIARATVAPARVLRRPDLGTLASGVCGDAVILRAYQQDNALMDCDGEIVVGQQRLAVERMVCRGRLWNPA